MGLNKNTLNNEFTAFYFIHKLKVVFVCRYSVRRLIGSLIIESAIYCNQILLVPVYLNMYIKTSVNWIIRLLLSLLCRHKVILISGRQCSCLNVRQMKYVSISHWLKNLKFITGIPNTYCISEQNMEENICNLSLTKWQSSQLFTHQIIILNLVTFNFKLINQNDEFIFSF